MSQMFTQVLGMGAAAIPMLRTLIDETGKATNGNAPGNGVAKLPAKKPVEAS